MFALSPNILDNRAYTDVFGPKEEDPEIQLAISVPDS
jgi:hypothetical protein